jgi:uncharacterized protein (DUF2461 family)
MPDATALNRIRTAIARNKGKAFLKVADELKKAKLAYTHGEQLSRLPRGFEALKGTALDVAVRKKSFIVEQPLSDKEMASPKLPAVIADFTERAMPLLRFGWAALD